MQKINLHQLTRRSLIAVSIFALIFATFPSVASAAAITARRVTIGSSAPSVTTTYAFTFTVPSATVLQSASFTACTTASGTCTTPAGFSVTGSTLTSQPTNLGDATGWTVNTATPGSLRLSKSGNVAAPTGNQTVSFSNVTNPSASNATFFMRIATFSDAAWTTGVDNGTVATSTAGNITVTASVDEALTLTLASATVALGSLSTSTTGTGTSTVGIATNASSGYSLTYSGTTLTSGSNTITALGSPTASSIGTRQFGINLVSNSSPSVGTAVSGTGTGVAATGYNTTNQFKFLTGDTVATAAAPTNTNTFTVSYIANIDGSTAAGAYSTVLNYVATANF